VEARASRPSSPWAFVPLLYFLQGIPYWLVQAASTTFFAAARVPVETIGHAASLLTLPWTLKPLWSPLVDLIGSKRRWILAAQACLVAGIGALALAVTSSELVSWTVIACAWIAIASATADVAMDGFYLLALDRRDQAAFVGVRSAAYRLARVLVTGGVVYLAGRLEAAAGGLAPAWMLALGAACAIYALGTAACLLALPRPERDAPARREGGAPVLTMLGSYFRQPRIAAVLLFILFYRFGESVLTPMGSPFLLATRANGGLGFAVSDVGLLLGTAGVVALLAGGILGGVLIARCGLRRCLWPMVLAMNVPNVLYVWAASVQPGQGVMAAVIGVEQFGYGFGFTAYLVFLMRVSQRAGFETTHYAISTGLMGLSAMAAGFVSGHVVSWLGWRDFFVAVCLFSLPGMAVIPFVPLGEEPDQETGPKATG